MAALPAGTMAAPPSSRRRPRLLVLGDSLSAGYGLPRDSGWVALLGQRLDALGMPAQIVNASVSGDTAWNGARRLPALLGHHRPDILVLALGANDGLKGLPLNLLREDLTGMVRLAQSQNVRVLLVGMRLPPFVDARYNEAFGEVYRDVAAACAVPLVPFLLEGVERRADMFLPDRLHPSGQAQATLAANVWGGLRPLLQSALASAQ